MSRTLFLSRLRQGLKGLSPDEIDDIVMDYEAHFSDAIAAGRSESDVAASLGDAIALGRELNAETRMRRWEMRRSPGNFVQAGLGMVGLQAFNIFILAPVIAGCAALAALAAYVLFVAGITGVHLLSGPSNGNVLVPTLVGLALIFGVIGFGGLIALLLGNGLRLLGRYVRLNYRLLKPDAEE